MGLIILLPSMFLLQHDISSYTRGCDEVEASVHVFRDICFLRVFDVTFGSYLDLAILSTIFLGKGRTKIRVRGSKTFFHGQLSRA